jgi:hypothetical protein
MSKKTKKGPLKRGKKRGLQPPAFSHDQQRPEESDGRPDYGGIPDRDLKKNLGCG